MQIQIQIQIQARHVPRRKEGMRFWPLLTQFPITQNGFMATLAMGNNNDTVRDVCQQEAKIYLS